MSSTKPNTRRPQELRGWKDRLRGYALAAGAAGVGLLALNQPAQAEIVFTPADMTLTYGTLFIDVNGDGISDFVFAEKWFDLPSSRFPIVEQIKLAVGGNPGAGVIASGLQASVLNSGSVIGSSRVFRTMSPDKLLMAFGNDVYTTSAGTCCFDGYGAGMTSATNFSA